MAKTVRHIVALCFVLLLSQCSGYTYISSVPSVPVYFSYNVLSEDPTFVPANTGAYKLVVSKRYETDYIGYAGLLLYIGMDMHHHAFDIACPHCLSVRRTLTIDGMFAVCPICTEQYDVSYGYGTPTKGISKEPLRKYNCAWNGTVLTVSN